MRQFVAFGAEELIDEAVIGVEGDAETIPGVDHADGECEFADAGWVW